MAVGVVRGPSPVTPRQLEAIRAHIDAGSTKGAAALLGLSASTVRNHLAAARDRLGVDTTEQAVYQLVTRGTLGP